jgi:hypothetical protein
MGRSDEREEDYGSQESDQEAGETQEARTDQAAPGFCPSGYRVIAEVPLTAESTLPTLDPALVLFTNTHSFLNCDNPPTGEVEGT